METQVVRIEELGAEALADDAVMRAWYDLNRRAESVGREEMPFWSWEDFLGGYRHPDSGERQQLFGAYDGDRLVGTAVLWTPLLDNTDKAYFKLDVDVTDRRRGIGRALAGRVEETARADGRAMVMSESKMPYDAREGHGYRLFAEACGYELANYEVVRHLALPVPDEQLQGWLDEAAPHHEGYTLETFGHDVPADLVDQLCVLLGQLAVDAPTGAVDFDEEKMTPERFAEMLDTVKAMGRARYETVALTADRQVVAHSTLAVPLTSDTTVYQWGTFVHREHRGHRLGLATKAANLRAVQAVRDDLALVTTQNAETNDFMVSINERMGFRPVEVSAEFVKRF